MMVKIIRYLASIAFIMAGAWFGLLHGENRFWLALSIAAILVGVVMLVPLLLPSKNSEGDIANTALKAISTAFLYPWAGLFRFGEFNTRNSVDARKSARAARVAEAHRARARARAGAAEASAKPQPAFQARIAARAEEIRKAREAGVEPPPAQAAVPVWLRLVIALVVVLALCGLVFLAFSSEWLVTLLSGRG